MASSSRVFVAAAVLVAALLSGGASGQSTSGCATAIVGLAPCLGYITGNSSTTPSSSCCSQLSSVVKSQPQCLCLILNGGAARYGIAINQTQALALPGACNVSTPPVSACAALAGPAASPSPSTAAAPEAGAPVVTIAPSGGVKNTQTTTGTSAGSSARASLSPASAVVLLLASAIAGLHSF